MRVPVLESPGWAPLSLRRGRHETYLRLVEIERSAGIADDADASAPRLLRLLRDNHPAMRSLGPREPEITQVLLAMGTAVDAIGTIRNTASVAHANDTLIDQADAMLVVNAVRTILHYLDARLGGTLIVDSVWIGPA